MWREERPWNIGVLQRARLSKLVIFVTIIVIITMLIPVLAIHLDRSGHLPFAAMSLLRFDTQSNRYAELHHFIYQSYVLSV
jgi:hypothetical protein